MNINDFLQSNHKFNKIENLEKFRFKFLNTIIAISILFVLFHFILIFFDRLTQNFYFQIALFSYSILSIGVLFLLRKAKAYYIFGVYFFLINSLILFFFTLIFHPEDEFRLISFFLASFSAFILIGKNYGLQLSLVIFVSILVLSKFFDLQLSSMALSTFSTFFIIFLLFSYLFLEKVENDVSQFNYLYGELEKNMDKEIKHRQKQEHMLLHQARLATMGEMIESIAHQWRQPLMNINIILMNINRKVELNKNSNIYIEEKINEIVELTGYMSQTIDDFKVLLKDNKVKSFFNLNTLIQDTLKLLSLQLEDISLYYHNKEKVMFYGHYSELMQIVMILLNNAIDVLKSRDINHKKIYINIQQKKSYILLSIEDNAGGIPFSNFDNIFNPYFTTKKEQEGTGLGLYIAQLIIQKENNNKLEVQNTSQGAKFTLFMLNEYSSKVKNDIYS